ncbi:sulfatase family protein [Peristeroidobacter agariperforans]|uniref:sulfatase family protein n=1 Tax=Peristeroidobacter agariperforans TaxID=268404 RepID=UPI00101D67DF|nr:sulfatase [Peristeroidobacter agariperforans]
MLMVMLRIGALGALCMTWSGVLLGAPPRPNVVVVIADQLRYQSLGYAGDPRAITPNIDLLAKQGVNFKNFVASTPVCSAFRASLLTGKYSSSTGMVVNELRLNPNQDALAHILNRAGYVNALIGKWHLWANDSDHGTIANQFVPPGPYRLGFEDYWAGFNFWHLNYNAFYFTNSDVPQRISGYGPKAFTELATQYIREKARRRQPFNLVLALSPPHDPWTEQNVPAHLYRKFKGVNFQFPSTWQDSPDPRMDRNTDPKAWHEFWKRNLIEFMRVYYAMVSSVDEQLGALLKALDEAAVADNTVVVFTSDHGEMFGAHGRVFKMTFYEESVRVPLLIRWPGKIPKGLVSDATISTPDLLPTILGLLKLRIPDQVEGADVSHLALGQAGPQPEFAFLQGMGHTFLWKDGFEWRALRDKRYTYARYRSDGRELLFDNLSDPQQANNLADDAYYSKDLLRWRTRLDGRMRELGDEFLACSSYRDLWTRNRVVLRAAHGEFRREDAHDQVPVDINYQSTSDRGEVYSQSELDESSEPRDEKSE